MSFSELHELQDLGFLIPRYKTTNLTFSLMYMNKDNTLFKNFESTHCWIARDAKVYGIKLFPDSTIALQPEVLVFSTVKFWIQSMKNSCGGGVKL